MLCTVRNREEALDSPGMSSYPSHVCTHGALGPCRGKK